ncbi:MAG: phosphopentomutase [Leptotrichiaceae bacterium]|nr:phosphopentomutase [Leptotrichiaceae bacterium]MBP6281524.1 phosphopentomutase [Leptotrichiaceae bacterium]MBP7101074.1 phosphopentomutase [Leptotrichiaceae bacterium]MBP7739511.1 phosphopentomutase [Leptotrichiaceae bacterium]MBP9629224.1 phosphopentomutase [Leptotrichiaceae bacterium]
MNDISRITLIVLDSVGAGELPDAHIFSDEGSNTLGNMAKAVGGMSLPNMGKLGLGNIVEILGTPKIENSEGAYGKAVEVSIGKDSTTGHWEIAGVPLERPFPSYSNGFSDEVIKEFEEKTGRKVMVNRPMSGTAVIDEYGEKQIETGNWIVYGSADPVFQIAANEDIIPLEELYKACEIALDICNRKSPVARVIARPYIGKKLGEFQRTSNRHDFSIDPPKESMLERIQKAGLDVIGIGKTSDLFNGKGITINKKANQDNLDGIKKTIEALKENTNGLIFTNLVDFDTVYGHRRDAKGYVNALKEFDNWLPEIEKGLRDDEILIITADHGNDPTFKGTDHTREYIPILITGKKVKKNTNIGTRKTFSDIASTIEEILLGVKKDGSFAKDIL